MVKILVIDDEEDICEMLTEELQKIDIHAEYAMTGEQAVKKIEAGNWDAIVVDLKLATSMSGLDVIRNVRQTKPQIKVIAMTGYIDMGLKQETDKLGVCDYLIKPDDILPEVFQRRVKRLLGGVK